MLSKFEHARDGSPSEARLEHRQWLLEGLARHYRGEGLESDIAVREGGTLGLCFGFTVHGRRRFLKTHLAGAAHGATLRKEAEILSRLYGAEIGIESFELEIPERGRWFCLVMDELQPLAIPLAPAEVEALVAAYSAALADFPLAAGLPDFADVVAAADLSLQELVAAGLVTDAAVRTGAQSAIDLLKSRQSGFARVLCHGDLSNRNVMADDASHIVIDWEDAFRGIADYDLLYWSTFIDNRTHYRDVIGRSSHEREVSVAILAAVVTLKSCLALRNGSFVRHKLSTEDRLREVLAL